MIKYRKLVVTAGLSFLPMLGFQAFSPDQQQKIGADNGRRSIEASVARPKIQGIAHAAFYVNDLEKTRVFYKDFLGYAEPFALKKADQSADRIAFIKINDHQDIELFNEQPRAIQ